MHRFKRGLLFVGLILLGLLTNVTMGANLQLDKLHLPPGFHIEVLTDAVPNARQMTLGRYADGRGVLYVGSMGAGNVYAVELEQGRAKAVHTIASGLPLPVGVAYRDGQLYVSAVSRIHWQAIPGRVPQQRVHCRARFMEPQQENWLPGCQGGARSPRPRRAP
jgi:hypothetical protein